MSDPRFDNEEEVALFLQDKPPGAWVTYEGDDGVFVVHELSFAERVERRRADRDSVDVRFGTTADLLQDEMTDQDWIDLGRFVAEVAAETRDRLARGLNP